MTYDSSFLLRVHASNSELILTNVSVFLYDSSLNAILADRSLSGIIYM